MECLPGGLDHDGSISSGEAADIHFEITNSTGLGDFDVNKALGYCLTAETVRLLGVSFSRCCRHGIKCVNNRMNVESGDR